MSEHEHVQEQEYITCPHCGKDDIKYGVAVCSGCQAEITYGKPWFKMFLFCIAIAIIGIFLLGWNIWVGIVVILLGGFGARAYWGDRLDRTPYFNRIYNTKR